MSSLAKNTPIITVANSGAEDPAAINVAPATSGDNFNSKMQTVFNKFKLIDLKNIFYPRKFCLKMSRNNRRKRWLGRKM